MYELKLSAGFPSPLIRQLEKERQRICEEASRVPGYERVWAAFETYALQRQLTKFCNMGLRRSWREYEQALLRGHMYRTTPIAVADA